MTVKDYHTMNFRCPKDYAEFYDELSFTTGLSIASLVRLAMHIAPYTEEFRNAVETYAKRHKHQHPKPSWKRHEARWLTM